MMVPAPCDMRYARCAIVLFFGMIAGCLAAGALPESRRVPDKKAERSGKKGRYDVDGYVQDMTGEACANMCGDLLKELRLKFSGRYNAK